jgi:hypothetical protein
MIFGAEFSCNKLAIPVVSFVGTNLLQDSNDKHNVSFNNEVSRDAGNFMRHDMIHNWKHGHVPPHNCFDLLYFLNPFSVVLCRIIFKYNWRRGRLSFKRGRMMRTRQPCLCPCVVHGLEKMESRKVFQVKKEVQG